MASYEGIGSPFLKQPSARSPKLGIYESLFLLNEGMDHVITLLREMEKLPFADRESVQCAVVEIEEVRCDMNADFTEKLADSERFDEGRFWKQKRAFEKKWRDPDDVYIDVQRREEERKKQGRASFSTFKDAGSEDAGMPRAVLAGTCAGAATLLASSILVR